MEEKTIKGRFESKIKPVLKYVGTIGAVLMAIAYIAIVLIMVFGLNLTATVGQSIIFAAVNAVMGLIIMQFLKIQGIDLAKEIEENKAIIKQYNNMKTKDKKFRSIKFYWTSSLIKDISIKGLTLAASTLCIIYIVIAGTQNYTWLLLAIVNLIMFGCFGLLALVNAYDFFNENHIPYIQEKINEADKERKQAEFEAAQKAAEEREKTIEAEVQRRVEMVKKELDQQRNDMVHADRGSNILESSVDNCASCSIDQSVVLDSDNRNNCVLGGTIHASSCSANRLDISSEEGL